MAIVDTSFPDLHDYQLVSLGWDADARVLAMSFRSEQDRVDVRLAGVTRLRVTNMMEGNIVDESMVISSMPLGSHEATVDPGKWVEILVLGDNASDSIPTSVRNFIEDTSRDIEHAKHCLLVLTPSFGCEAVVLFSSFQASRGWNP